MGPANQKADDTDGHGKNRMKILIDIGHPAHVHFFRNAIRSWNQSGDEVLITSRDKDVALQLLNGYGFTHNCLSCAHPAKWSLGVELLIREFQLFWLARRFRPDVMVAIAGTFMVHVGRLLRIPTVVFYDTEHARLQNAITYPFADYICTPSAYLDDLGPKHVRYPGYHELAYLHPNSFTPDPQVLAEHGLHENERFFIVRFISWNASHDCDLRGFSEKGKRRLVQALLRQGRVIITSEKQLPAEYEPYRLAVSPIKIHDLLAFASLYVGEGATMASEAAMLGVPAIFVNSMHAGTIHEQSVKYGLIDQIVDNDRLLARVEELLSAPGVRDEYARKREKMLSEKIDVTEWQIQFINQVAAKAQLIRR